MHIFKTDISRVTPRSGQPELYENGNRIAPMLYALSDIPGARPWLEPSITSIKQFHECGIDLIGVDTDLQSGWKEDGSYDLTPVLRELESTLASNPQARMLIRLHLNAPYHWLHSHPEELIVFETGERTDHGSYGDRVIQYDKFPEIKASIASKVFWEDCGKILRQFIQALKKHPFGAAVAAIQPAYGLNGEWHQFTVGDIGPSITKYYRDYCRKLYPTLADLRKVYGDEADYDCLRFPTSAERSVTPRTQNMIDSCKCLNYSVSEAIAYFSAIVREEWPEILCGSFYGYYFSVGTVSSGMLEPQMLLSDPNIDFFAGPSAYTANKWPGNTPLLRYLPESMRLNGKLFLCEMDQGPISWGSNALRGLGPSYEAKDDAEYAALLKRNICENLLRGQGAWFYDHRLPVWDIHEKHPYWNTLSIRQEITKLYKFAQRLITRPYEKDADVLVVFDTESEYHDDRNTFLKDTFGVIDALHKSGAAWDAIYLVDLDKVDLSLYHSIVFINCGYLNVQAQTQIQRVLSSDLQVIFCEEFGMNCGGAKEIVSRSNHPDQVVILDKTPVVPGDWREVFKVAKVHLWTEGEEVVTAGDGFVMIHSIHTSRTILHLPQGDQILDHPDGAADTVVIEIVSGKRYL